MLEILTELGSVLNDGLILFTYIVLLVILIEIVLALCNHSYKEIYKQNLKTIGVCLLFLVSMVVTNLGGYLYAVNDSVNFDKDKPNYNSYSEINGTIWEIGFYKDTTTKFLEKTYIPLQIGNNVYMSVGEFNMFDTQNIIKNMSALDEIKVYAQIKEIKKVSDTKTQIILHNRKFRIYGNRILYQEPLFIIYLQTILAIITLLQIIDLNRKIDFEALNKTSNNEEDNKVEEPTSI